MIKILVTQARYDECIDLVDSFELHNVNVTRAYEYLLLFVVDDDGNYIGAEAAKELFKRERVKRSEIGAYWGDFVSKVIDAYVPKVNGATSEEPS